MLWFSGGYCVSGSRKFWVGIAVGGALMALFFLRVDLGRLREALSGANYWFVAPAIGTYLVSVLFRTLRWQWLLRHLRPVGVVRLYPVVVIGYMANNLLPMRMGELVRSYYVGEREGISKTSALVTIFTERLLDALTLLLFIAAIALFVPVIGLAEAFRGSHGVIWLLVGAALVALFVAAFGALLLMAFWPLKARALGFALVGPLPKGLQVRMRHVIDMVLEGVVALRSPRTLMVLFLLSIPIWLLEAGLFFLIGLSFDLNDVYDNLKEMAVAMILVTAIANIGSSIPLAPGGLGLFEWVARETLVLLPLATMDVDVAAGYVLVVHFSLLIPMIVLGQLFLWAHHISLGSLSRAGRSAGAEAQMPAGGRIRDTGDLPSALSLNEDETG